MKNHLLRLGSPGRRRSPKQIARILRQHRRSGLSLLAFARQRQLCYATLLRWRKRQPKDRHPASESAVDPGFIPIQIEAGSLHPDYVLSWPTGRSLRIPPRFDAQALRQLLAVLEERT